jgi:coronin-7
MAFKSSKYRHALGKPQKKELWYPDLRPNGNSSDVTMIKASNKFVAVNWTSASATLAILNLDQVGKRKGDPFLLHVSGQLNDFDFSPFDDNLLATAADDAHIKLWKIPEGGLTENISTPLCDLTGHKKGVEVIAFHPTANNVLASGSADKTVKLWDVEKAQEKLSIDIFGDSVQGIAWNYDGSLIAVTSKDKKVRTIDPRASKVVSEGEGHVGLKASRVVWLGNTPRFLTTGFSKSRERQFAIWDATDLSKPLKMTTLDSSTGVITPIYDADTNILYIAGNGDSGVRAFEITEDKNLISDLTNVAGDLPQKGVAWVPKRALDVMDLEVARLLRLTQQAIIPVSFNVPRKTKSKFADDLFPNTPGPVPALSADEWFAGESKPPLLVNLDPESRRSYSSSPTASPSSSTSEDVYSPSFSSSPATSSPATSSPAVGRGRSESNGPLLSASGEPIARTGIVPKVVRSSKFRHILGKPVKKSAFYENVKAHGATSNTVIRANSKFFAVPWTGTGGLLAVIPHAQVGRLPPNIPCFEAGSTLLDFDLHPFNDYIAATADENAHIKLWNIPESGLIKPGEKNPKNITTATADLQGHTRKLTTLNFHPTADNILISTGADLVVKTWDINKQSQVHSVPGHTDLILGISVSYQGDLVATTCRDKMMRIVDPRVGKVTAETQGHAGAKGSRVTWLGNKPALFSVGFGKASDREFSLWDSRNLQTPTITRAIDQLSGVITPYYDEDLGIVYLAGRGDGSIKMFEIVDDDVHFLTEYNSSVPQMGVGLLPKQSLDVRGCEIARVLKVTDSTVEPIQMTVPRTRMEFWQDDIYPPTRAIKPAFSAEEWVGGVVSDPPLESLQPAGMTPLSQAPAVEKKASKIAASSVVDNTPSKEQVMSKFWQQTLSFKEGESSSSSTPAAADVIHDDEWED